MMFRFAGQLGKRQKTEDIHAVIEADKYDTLFREVSAIVLVLRRGAAGITAAMNKYDDRQVRVGRLGRCPHVHKKAVLADGNMPFPPGVTFRIGWRLHASRAEIIGSFDTRPGHDRLWRTPAEIAH